MADKKSEVQSITIFNRPNVLNSRISERHVVPEELIERLPCGDILVQKALGGFWAGGPYRIPSRYLVSERLKAELEDQQNG